jgi:GMP synthase (glutamine-hydrolysing)
MSHGDTIIKLPKNYKVVASTEDVNFAAYKIDDEQTYAIQFHPEVYHTTEGQQVLKNFTVDICGCEQNWTPSSFVETTVNELREKLGNDKVVLGLSGGVDSSVTGVLLNEAIGSNLTCIFVDNGLLRKDEFETVLHSYEGYGIERNWCGRPAKILG